jgi:hypothetical protein
MVLRELTICDVLRRGIRFLACVCGATIRQKQRQGKQAEPHRDASDWLISIGGVYRKTGRVTQFLINAETGHLNPLVRLRDLSGLGRPCGVTLQLGPSFILGVYSVTSHLSCNVRWNEERYDLQVFQIPS